MLFHVDAVEVKNSDWKVLQLTDISGTKFADVSVNRTNKAGEPFPGFDAIAENGSTNGNIWQSQAGKNYLFPMRAQAPGATRSAGPSGIKAAQERKAEGIEKAQDRRETGIKLAAAFRDATLMLINQAAYNEMSEAEIQGQHKFWRRWYLEQWDEEEKLLDVPFT